MLAVVDHRPRDSVHDRKNVSVKGIPQINIWEKGVGKIALRDDTVHDHQNGQHA